MERYIRFLMLVIVMMFSVTVQAAERKYILPIDSAANYYISYYPDPEEDGIYLLGNAACDGESYNTYGGHEGMDFIMSVGTPIYAAASGTVTRQQQSCSADLCYGNYLYINHGNSNWTMYAHLDSYVAGNSQFVNQGDLIAYSGTSGTSTPHLHWEVVTGTSAIGGNPHNPYYCDDEWFTTSPPTYADEIETCSTTTSSNAVHLMTVEPQSNGKYAIYGFQLTGSGNSATSSGNYWSYQNTGNQTTTFAWLSGDVNGDGYDDVVQTRVKSGRTHAQVYLSGGTGGLNGQTQWKKTSGQATKAFLADMDADGLADLILGFPNSDSTMTWKYYTSDGGSRFEDAVIWSTSFGKESDIFVVGDFNGNGKAELLRGRESDGSTGSNFSSTLIWRRLDTAGNESTVLDSYGYSGDSWLANDVNNDGNDELIRIDQADNTVTAYVATYNVSTQTFNAATSYATDVGGTDGQYYLYPIDYTDSYSDLLRFTGSDLKLLQSSGGINFEEQSTESTMVSGINSGATFSFGDYGDSTSTSETCISALSLDGDVVDPIDLEDTDPATWAYSSLDLSSQAAVDYVDLDSHPTCAVQSNGTLSVVITGQNGDLYALTSEDDGTSWTSTDISHEVWLPYIAAGTSPHVFSDATGTSDDLYVTFMSEIGRIQLSIYSDSSWTNLDLSALASVPYADTSTSPFGYVANGIAYVVFQGDNQRIYRFAYNGTSTSALDLSAQAAVAYAQPGSSPMATVHPTTGEHIISFQGNDQRIYQLFENNGSWTSWDLSDYAAHHYLDTGSQPWTYVDPTSGYVYTVLNGNDARIDIIASYGSNSFASADLTSLAAVDYAEPGTSPSGYIHPVTGNHIITFSGDDHRVYQFEGSVWSSVDLSAQTPVEYVASGTGPSLCVDAVSGVMHTVFTGNNGRVQYIRYGP